MDKHELTVIEARNQAIREQVQSVVSLPPLPDSTATMAIAGDRGGIEAIIVTIADDIPALVAEVRRLRAIAYCEFGHEQHGCVCDNDD